MWEGDRREAWSGVSTSVRRKRYLRPSWLFGASDGTNEAEAQVFGQHLLLRGEKVAWPP